MYTLIGVRYLIEYAQQQQTTAAFNPPPVSLPVTMNIFSAQDAGANESGVLLSFKAGKMEYKPKEGGGRGGKKPTFIVKPDPRPGMTLLHCC